MTVMTMTMTSYTHLVVKSIWWSVVHSPLVQVLDFGAVFLLHDRFLPLDLADGTREDWWQPSCVGEVEKSQSFHIQTQGSPFGKFNFS